jgi:hypothetical protein
MGKRRDRLACRTFAGSFRDSLPRDLMSPAFQLHSSAAISRRRFIPVLGVVLLGARWPAAAPLAHRHPHPEPRPGITGAKVLDTEEVVRSKAAELYDAAREYPRLFDGLYCYCRCEKSLGHRSLLSCFESDQAIGCLGCREEGKIVARMARAGKSLADIRAAVDKEWG